MVPYSQRSRLLATFNGGFTYVDGDNGSADNGQKTNEPLKDGNANTHWLYGWSCGHRELERRPEPRTRRRLGPTEPGSDRLE